MYMEEWMVVQTLREINIQSHPDSSAIITVTLEEHIHRESAHKLTTLWAISHLS